MTVQLFTRTCNSAEDTAKFARQWADIVRPGDTLLLSGDIGAGKTHFARHLIQSILTQPEDVPSPTFTLVQTYSAQHFEIWHADLYRLTGPDEIIELGLYDAFDTAVCLVEWPDRLGTDQPKTALHLSFSIGAHDGARVISVSGDPALWADRLETVRYV